MKQFAKEALCALLLASMLTSSACGGGTPAAGETTAASDETTAAETESEFLPDSLPELDFNGAEINILQWAENNEFVEEQTGDVIDDALYERDLNVESRLNVQLNHIGKSYTWDTRNEYIGAIRSSVMAGDNTYDIVSGQYATIPSLISDGVLTNMMKLDYLDFDKPWWIGALIDETAVDNKLYLAGGNVSRTSISTVCCMFANQRLLDEFGLENPVDIVNAGEWTIDKVMDMSKNVYSDLNNNGAADNGDRIGLLIYNANGITAFQQSFGLQLTERASDGSLTLGLSSERAINAMQKLTEVINNSEECYFNRPGKDIYLPFSEGRVLFQTGFFDNIRTAYNDMDDDFYILPYPKYEASQESYQTRLGEANALFGITADCPDKNIAAAVLEALASEGYRTVAPALYEVAFKVKYSRNDESAQMFDLIRSSVVFDWGALYGAAFGLTPSSVKHFFEIGAGDWVSYYESYRSTGEAIIAKFFETVQGLE